MHTPDNNTDEPFSSFFVIDRPWDHGIYQHSSASKIVYLTGQFNDQAPKSLRINGVEYFGGDRAPMHRDIAQHDMPFHEYHPRKPAQVLPFK